MESARHARQEHTASKGIWFANCVKQVGTVAVMVVRSVPHVQQVNTVTTQDSPLVRYAMPGLLLMPERMLLDQRGATTVHPDITHLRLDLQNAQRAPLAITPTLTQEQRSA
jgi:hypothetical protein